MIEDWRISTDAILCCWANLQSSICNLQSSTLTFLNRLVAQGGRMIHPTGAAG